MYICNICNICNIWCTFLKATVQLNGTERRQSAAWGGWYIGIYAKTSGLVHFYGVTMMPERLLSFYTPPCSRKNRSNKFIPPQKDKFLATPLATLNTWASEIVSLGNCKKTLMTPWVTSSGRRCLCYVKNVCHADAIERQNYVISYCTVYNCYRVPTGLLCQVHWLLKSWNDNFPDLIKTITLSHKC